MKRKDEKLDAELRYHIERLVADYMRGGMSEADARRRARLEFGGLDQVSEECRDARPRQWFETGLQDARFAARVLRRSPAFAAVAVLSLALGIGANTAIFSVMDALLLRSLPVSHPEQLVLFGPGRSSGDTNFFPNGEVQLFSWPFFEQVRANSRAFSDVAAIESMAADVHARLGAAGAELEPIKIRLVSDNYLAMLGVGASACPACAVMSHSFWARRFARDPSAIGRTLSFNGTAFTISSVASPEFFGTNVGESPDFWIPLTMQKQVQPSVQNPFAAEMRSLWIMGRMKPGIRMAEAQTEVNILLQRWLHVLAGPVPSAEDTQSMRKARVTLSDVSKGISRIRREFSEPLKILLVISGLVLLIACANIANLLLARAAGRQREIAVRQALGAGRGRLIRQLLCESLMLALAGGAVGVFLAWLGGEALLMLVANDEGRVALEVAPNLRAMLFTFGLSLITGIVFGIAPALSLTRADRSMWLKEKSATASRSQGRLSGVLVVGQVALALFLLIGAALFLQTFTKLENSATGFDKEHTLRVRLDSESIALKGPALLSVLKRVEARIRTLPGVATTGYSELTFDEGGWSEPVWPEGATGRGAKPQDLNRVGADYFEAMGMPLVMGRAFGRQDNPQSRHVAVVNETLAWTLFPDGSALGRHFSFTSRQYDFVIVGVVKNARYHNLRERPLGAAFFYNEQEQQGFDNLVVRARGRPEALMPQIRAVIRDEDKDLSIESMETLGRAVDQSLGQERLLATLAGFFGALALLLASIGLYGVIAYSVARRTGEIGIRMALGARPETVLTMVLRQALVLVVAGQGIGLAAALVCGRLIRSQLYGLEPHDPATLAGAVAVLLAIALIAAILPARRAARLDPLVALREE